ncbi:MAG: SMP-30/gluconolactonase/LRE family protein [Pseudomonadota bacterium]
MGDGTLRISLERAEFVGAGLNRPECVLAHRSGLLLAPDWTEPGGVSLIARNGRVRRLLATQPAPGVDLPVRANGIALEPEGTILIAHLGAERGGIYRLHADGHCEIVTDSVERQPMPPANFVLRDRRGDLWITVSTTRVPRALDYRPDAATGYVALHRDGETRIVADGLGYTNECLLSPDGATLWVNETFARKLTAFDVEEGGLTNRRTVGTFGPGTFPDGLALTEDGSLLVTSIVSNRILLIGVDGSSEVLLEDADPGHLAWVEAAFQAGEMGRPHLDEVRSSRLRNISNLAFGGGDLTTGYLGCLLGDAVAAVRMPMRGHPPDHWDADLGPLAKMMEDV